MVIQNKQKNNWLKEKMNNQKKFNNINKKFHSCKN